MGRSVSLVVWRSGFQKVAVVERHDRGEYGSVDYFGVWCGGCDKVENHLPR